MKWVVATTKENFLGKQAVMEEIKNGVSRKLFGLQTEGRRPPRTGQLIVKDGKLLGSHERKLLSVTRMRNRNSAAGHEKYLSGEGHDSRSKK